MARPLGTEHDPFAHAARRGRDIERLKRRSAMAWHLVGDTSDPVSPPFLNGWRNAGGSLMPLKFRQALYGCVQIQGSVTGGARGTAVCVLPALYRPQDAAIEFVATDGAGKLVPIRIDTNGTVTVVA